MEWMISSSALILIFMALRRILRGRITARLQYALWVLVLVRLVLPVQLSESPLSVLRVTRQPEIRSVMEAAREPIRVERQIVIPDRESGEKTVMNETTFLAEQENINHFYTPAELALAIWKWGCVLLVSFIFASNLHFLRKLVRNRRKFETGETELPVYISSQVGTPCLAGLFRPAIYLPEQPMEPEALRHVLAHEMTHYRHRDHMVSVFRCAALALHWYNPLVWWAARASREDGELACDEGTVARLGEEERIAYGRTLLEMTCVRPGNDIMLTATTMYTGKKSLRERIKRIARHPKTTTAALCVLHLAVAFAFGCTFTGGGETEPVLSSEEVIQRLEKSEEMEETLVLIAGASRKDGIGVYKRTDYGRKGWGHDLSDDQIQSLEKIFSQYQWSRETEVAAITESDRWMELSFGVSPDADWRVRLECGVQDQELVFLSFYDLEDGTVTDARENLIFRAVPGKDGTSSLYQEMGHLFRGQTEERNKNSEKTILSEHRPLVEQTEDSLALIGQLQEHIARTKSGGEGSLRMVKDGQAYVLELDDAQLDMAAEFFARYRWEETGETELQPPSENAMTLVMRYGGQEEMTIQIVTREEESVWVELVCQSPSGTENPEIRHFRALEMDENTYPLFHSLMHVFQAQELAQQQRGSGSGTEGENAGFLAQVQKVMETNDGAMFYYPGGGGVNLRQILTEQDFPAVMAVLEQYHWLTDFQEGGRNEGGIELIFSDGTMLAFSPDYESASLLLPGQEQWVGWQSRFAENTNQRLYPAMDDLWQELLLREYDERKGSQISEMLYESIMGMKEDCVFTSIFGSEEGAVALNEVERRFCAEMMRSYGWIVADAPEELQTTRREGFRLEGNGCTIRYFGERDLIEYSRDGESRYFWGVSTGFTAFSLYSRMDMAFGRISEGGGAYPMEGMDGQEAAQALARQLPEILESCYGKAAGLKAEDVTVEEARWEPYDHWDTTVTYEIQISLPMEMYQSMNLKETEVQARDGRVILKGHFSMEGANRNFWICSRLEVGGQRLIPQ